MAADYLVHSRDGRPIGFMVSGDPSGRPVVLMHGTPGSRVGPFPSDRVLHDLGVCLITFDRPGYGRSARLAARTVADVAGDVRAIADALGLSQFAVLGRSGGGPHALACAALLPDRVTRAAALVSLAPRTADGLDWFAGMSDSNIREFEAAASTPVWLEEAAARIRANPSSHLASLDSEMPEPDRRIADDTGLRAMTAHSFAEGLRSGAAGWIDDDLAFCAPWGFGVADIKVPVLLWHGEMDVFSPPAHTRWLARNIPGATATIEPGRGHLGAHEVVPDALSWLARTI